MGVGILRGIQRYWFSKMHQDSQNWSSKLSWESAIHHQLFKKYRGLFKIILDLVGCTYVLRSPTFIQDFLRFSHPVFRSYLKRPRLKIVLDPPQNNVHYYAFCPFQHWPSALLLEDSHPILLKIHFMFSGRYWSHITRIPFMFSGRYWSSYLFGARFSQHFQTNGKMFWDCSCMFQSNSVMNKGSKGP